MRTPEHSSAAFTGSSVQADVSCFCCQISDPRTNEFTKHKNMFGTDDRGACGGSPDEDTNLENILR